MRIEDINNAIDAEQYDRERAAVAFAKLHEKAAADQAAAMRLKCLDLVEARMQAAGVLDWRESPLYGKFLAASGSEKYAVLDELNKAREKKAREVLDEVAREAQAQNNRKLMGCVITVESALSCSVIGLSR